MIVLDTNVVSELMRVPPSPQVLAWVDAQRTSTLHLTATVVAELVYGVARLPDGKRETHFLDALARVLEDDFVDRILPFDARAAAEAGVLVANQERNGRAMSVGDAQIAAVCRTTGADLATRNSKDFAGLGIEIVNPWG